MIDKIVSGGQTGVDRAALDIAILNNIPYGGWCPKGRLDEEGVIPTKYASLTEVSGTFANDIENYAERTIENIKDSDGTLIFLPSFPLLENIKDGTLLTLDNVRKNKKPYLLIHLDKNSNVNSREIKEWIIKNNIHTLNIAGPRESSSPGIYQATFKVLQEFFQSNCKNKSKL